MERDSKKSLIEKVFFKKWHPYVWILIIGVMVYLKTMSFGFVDYDDKYLIVTNHNFLSDLSNIPRAFIQDVFYVPYHYSSRSYYRPLLTISLMLDTQFGGISPFVYHLTNIIIHLIASCLLFLFLLKLRYKKDLALFFSLVFTVHPVLTQAVAWIPGRNDSLLSVFIMLSFTSFINLLDRKKWSYYFLYMLFFAMALFTKETALALIFVSIYYMYFMKKEKLSLSVKISMVTGWLLITSLWFLLRAIAVKNLNITIPYVIKSIFLNLPGVIQYAGKILFPFNLSVHPIMKDVNFLYGFLALILLLTALLISKNKRIKFIGFGSSWFVLFILPSLISSNPGLYANFFESRIYLPIIGFIIILLETDLVKRLDCKKKSSMILSSAVIFIFSLLTFYHSNNMRNEMSFWENAVSTSPHSSVVHLYLGDKYYSSGLIDKAELEFRKALELNPEQQIAHNNLGRIYANKQMFKKAEYEFTVELKINPNYENAIYNLGMLKYEQGKSEEAVHLWEKTLEINPYHIKANKYLAVYYLQRGNFARANSHIKNLQKRGITINTEFLKALN